MENTQPKDDNEEQLSRIVKNIIKIFRNDAIMITIIIIALIICVYLAYYSHGYDKKIQRYYHEYIKEHCLNQSGEPVYGRPPIFTLDSFAGVVINETKS